MTHPRTDGTAQALSKVSVSTPQAKAWVEGNTIVCTDLQIDSHQLASELQSCQSEIEAGAICQETLELGAKVRELSQASADTVQLAEQVRKLEETFGRVTSTSSEQIMKSIRRATDQDSGLISLAVKRETGKLTKVIEKAFDGNDKRSALAKIQSAVQETVQRLGDESSRAVYRLLEATDPESPMSRLQSNIRKDVVKPVQEMLATLTEVKEAIEIRVAVKSEQDKGTQKGRKFEDLVGDCLERYATTTGEPVEHVGNFIGNIPRCKTGDELLRVRGPNGRTSGVVFESKDQRLTTPKVADELDQACENRGAEIAVMVFSQQDLAPFSLPIHRLAAHRWIVVFDKESQDELALRMAFQLARMEALTLLHGGDGEVDVDFVLSRTAEARKTLRMLDELEKGLRQAERGVDLSRSTAQDLRDRLERLLDELENSLQEGQQGAA